MQEIGTPRPDETNDGCDPIAERIGEEDASEERLTLGGRLAWPDTWLVMRHEGRVVGEQWTADP